MKLLKRISYFVCIAMAFSLFDKNVYAYMSKPSNAKGTSFHYKDFSYSGDKYRKNYYDDGSKKVPSYYFHFMYRTVNSVNRPVFCLDYGKNLPDSSGTYTPIDFLGLIEKAGGTVENYDHANLIAFYADQLMSKPIKNGDKYYAAGSLMLWEYLDSIGWYGVNFRKKNSEGNWQQMEIELRTGSSFGGGTALDLTAERAAITNAINNHKVTPSFCGSTYELLDGEEKTITDDKGVLGTFTVEGDGASQVTVSGNNLTLKGTKRGSFTVNFTKGSPVGDKAYVWQPPSSSDQRVFDLPSVPRVECAITFSVTGNPQTGEAGIYIFIGVSMLTLLASLGIYNSDKLKTIFKKR